MISLFAEVAGRAARYAPSQPQEVVCPSVLQVVASEEQLQREVFASPNYHIQGVLAFAPLSTSVSLIPEFARGDRSQPLL
jgi:hypothetical protein